MCVKIVERAAEYTDALGSFIPDNEDDQLLARKLQAEYFVVRTMLVSHTTGFSLSEADLNQGWKQNRLDIAEHMFNQANQASTKTDSAISEELADTLFEIGKDLLSKKQYETSATWLQRALDVLQETTPENLSADAAELQLCILESLVRAFLGVGNQESHDRAVNLLSLIETEHGDKMIVLLLKLEIILSEPEVNAQQYFDILLRMIRSIHLISNNIKTLIYHIHRLKELNAELAGKALDGLFELRLLNEPDKEAWLERALITRIWIAVSSVKDGDHALRQMQTLLDNIHRAFRQPVSSTATHAAQTLLWKRIESSFTASNYETAESWCRIASHAMFKKCGELNRCKIERKMIQCSLNRNDLAGARQVFFQMTDTGKSAPLTRYLMYKVAIREGDKDFATENLVAMCKDSSKDTTLLYACVVEAQSSGDKQQVTTALQKVLERYDFSTSQDVHLPALLRSMIKLLLGEVPANATPSNEVMQELCKIFQLAATQASRKRKTGEDTTKDIFDTHELEWFTRMSYNTAIKHCANTHPHSISGLLAACTKMLDLLIAASPVEDQSDLRTRQLNCRWLEACTYIVLARAEDNAEQFHQNYLAVRKCGISFRQQLSKQMGEKALDATVRDDLTNKHFQLVKLELEAALKLCQWDEMDELFKV